MDDNSPLDDWDWSNDDTNRSYIEPSTRWSREKTRYLFKTNFLTPYKICLLALIDAYCDQGNEDFEVPLLYFLIDRLSVCDDYSYPEPTLPELCVRMEESDSANGKSIKMTLFDKLRDLETPHEFIAYIQHTGTLLTRNEKDEGKGLSRYSLFGIFVRRCHIECLRLSFAEISLIWNAFVEYKLSCLSLEPDNSVYTLSHVAKEYTMHKQEIISKNDAEKFAVYVITQLQLYGGILPPHLESKIRMIHKRLPEISTIYYIEYIDCMQSGEYEGALRNFYNFSNFCPVDEAYSKSWYQHVLLNLVKLHAKFGHKEQALLAISETIRMARESNDQECLRFALSWLYYLKSYEYVESIRLGATEQQMLDSMIDKAKEANFSSLQSLGELGKAAKKLQQAIIKHCFIRDYNRCQLSTDYLSWITLGVWDIYGDYNSMFSLEDSTCKRGANSNLIGNNGLSTLYSSQIITQKRPNPEDSVIAYCQIAEHHMLNGNYTEAIRLFMDSINIFIDIRRAASQWISSLGRIKYTKSLESCEFYNIEALEIQLRAACQYDPIVAADFEYQRASHLSKSNREGMAVELLHSLIEQSSRLRSTNQMNVANYLLKLAEIRMTSTHQTSALPYVLSSLCLSERFHYRSSYLMAIIRLAEILLSFNLATRSIGMIEKIMPELLAEHSLRLQSVGQLVYAECIIASITEDQRAVGRTPTNSLNDTIPFLDAALTGFSRLFSIAEALKVLQLQAYVYNAIGSLSSRNEAASAYLNLLNRLEYNESRHPDHDSYYYGT
ncbi:3404_t:CDS:10 [Paraglomus occultum]|uniref:Anaphase-promoting complex subunit 5 n=1 Tax=Paraglomus occultum TaxID=144539 RepID=A0A9N9B095_9GLOM|nr:3404_t:CDS:10 [Paraglomus occultum]